MSGFLLFARTRASPRTVLAVLVTVVLSAGLQGRAFIAPVVPWEPLVLTTPLLPAVIAMAGTAAFSAPLPELEEADARTVGQLRTAWACTWLAGVSLGWFLLVAIGRRYLSPSAEAPFFSAAAAGRNAMCFLAIALCSGVLLGADLGWVLPAVVVTVLVFFGRAPDQQPHHWAVLLHGSAHLGDWVMAIVLGGMAVAGYRYHDAVGLARRWLRVST